MFWQRIRIKNGVKILQNIWSGYKSTIVRPFSNLLNIIHYNGYINNKVKTSTII